MIVVEKEGYGSFGLDPNKYSLLGSSSTSSLTLDVNKYSLLNNTKPSFTTQVKKTQSSSFFSSLGNLLTNLANTYLPAYMNYKLTKLKLKQDLALKKELAKLQSYQPSGDSYAPPQGAGYVPPQDVGYVPPQGVSANSNKNLLLFGGLAVGAILLVMLLRRD